jgi:Heparinase II/III-like protein/Heparinase II/III N-terminus
MADVAWYLRRLAVMSGPEILHRVIESVGTQRHRLSAILTRRAETPPPGNVEFCRARDPILPELNFAFAPSEQEQRDLLAGNWPALGCAWRWMPDAHVWDLAPDTTKRWPRGFYQSISFRPGNPHGDVRLAWEPARLQQLVSLALLGRRFPEHRRTACELLERMFDSWVRENPPYLGIHYVSAMECGLRLIAVCYALDLARNDLTRAEDTWTNALRLARSHAPFIEDRLSLHSSSGNHSVAEGAALVHAGLLFPELRGARRWYETGLRLLEREAARQVLPDGGPVEQAFWYHLFVLDLLGLTEALLAHRGCRVPTALVEALARGRDFVTAVADASGNLPPIGDADGGHALSKHLRLLPPCPPNPTSNSRTFVHSGYSVLGTGPGSTLRAILDHGPLGMPPSFGHGHADALSVWAWVRGKALLRESGTFAYGLGAPWRDYFRGTRAHNTVLVDGRDQAVGRGAFLWSAPFTARLLAATPPDDSDHGRWLARHDAYTSIGVTHWRGVSLTRAGTLVVWDRLEGAGEHRLELNWHLGEDLPQAEQISPDSSKVEIRFEDDTRLLLEGGRVLRNRGELDPLRGWCSDTYGSKRPMTTVTLAFEGRLPHEFVSVLRPTGTDSGSAREIAVTIRKLRALHPCHFDA